MEPFDIPEVNTDLIDTKIEMLWEFNEPNNTIKLSWCSGTVISLRCNYKVVIDWDGEISDTQEQLSAFKFNTSTKKAWKLCVQRKINQNVVEPINY